MQVNTMLDRYRALTMNNPDIIPDFNLLSEFLQHENDRALERWHTDETSHDQIQQECLMLYQAIQEDYLDIKFNPEPFIIQIGRALYENQQEFPERPFPYRIQINLNPKQEAQHDKLLDYIFKHNGVKTISIAITCQDDDVISEDFKFAKNLDDEITRLAKQEVSPWIKSVIKYTGAILVGIAQDMNGNQDIIFGFECNLNKITPVSTTRLKQSFESDNPDRPANKYIIPDIDLT